MPRTLRKGGANLDIQLTDAPPAYRPGDILLGNVVRSAPIVSAQGRIVIKLLGRAKVKISHRRGNNPSVFYRSRYNFFEDCQCVDRLVDGPLHVAPGGQPGSWSFAIAIPEHPNPKAVNRENSQEHSYLPLEHERVAAQPLPGTFFLHHNGFGPEFEAFVEYFLEAELIVGNSRKATATLPFPMRAGSTLTPIRDFKPNGRPVRCSAASLRLIPGMEEAELSLKQKAQKFFGSSTVPRFNFAAQVSVPTIIQLEHPTPIPLTIRALPDRATTSEVIRDVAQTITLGSIRLMIVAQTEVRCASDFSGMSHVERAQQSLDLGTKWLAQRLKGQGPLVLPGGPDAGSLNLGERIELKLDANHVYAFGRPVMTISQDNTLHCSFATYNTRVSHTLEWEVVFLVAGEKCTTRGQLPLKILAPSEEQEAQKLVAMGIQPPLSMQEEVPSYCTAVENQEALPSYTAAAGPGSSESTAPAEVHATAEGSSGLKTRKSGTADG